MKASFLLQLFIPSVALFLMLLVLSPCQAKDMKTQQDSMTQEIKTVADREFVKWIATIPEDQIQDYGFANRQEVNEAKILEPLPSFIPARNEKSLTPEKIEQELSDSPQRWHVPVTTNNKIVCLVTVKLTEKKEPTAVAFGKAFAANRLDAGYRLLGWPTQDIFNNLALLSFYDPVYAILMHKDDTGKWEWVNLTGTQQGKAQIMSSSDIADLLKSLKESQTRIPPQQ